MLAADDDGIETPPSVAPSGVSFPRTMQSMRVLAAGDVPDIDVGWSVFPAEAVTIPVVVAPLISATTRELLFAGAVTVTVPVVVSIAAYAQV